MNDLTRMSKFISLILRHKPQTVGIALDAHGWADVGELIDGINASGRGPLDRQMLEKIVQADEKQRYAFSDDSTRIRANQGHSIPVDVELKQVRPPAVLYHGTAERFTESIGRKGLIPNGRLYVHLSADVETAKKVGMRHGRPVVYAVDARAMAEQGHAFYLSANGVWLTREVPAVFLEIRES